MERKKTTHKGTKKVNEGLFKVWKPKDWILLSNFVKTNGYRPSKKVVAMLKPYL